MCRLGCIEYQWSASIFIIISNVLTATCQDSVGALCDPQGENCAYNANWTVRGDLISFEVRATTVGWVGIGFSDDQMMVSTSYQVNIVSLTVLYTCL